jgi:vancomycin resistance protein YoaR
MAVPFILVCSVALSLYMALGTDMPLMDSDLPGPSDISSGQTVQNDPDPSQGKPSQPETPSDSQKPAITEQTVVISEYKAVSQSTNQARATNIAWAVQAIDGRTIAPGATFSFNDAVGDTEADERYLEAPVVDGANMQYARGGGICQVSTALYIAALSADLRIDERHPHTVAVDYAPPSLDATLDYGTLDLKITNTSAYPVTIVATAQGQTVTVGLKGHALDNGLAIEAISKVIGYYDAAGNSQDLNNLGNIAPGEMYCKAESYRVYYLNGVKTKDELLAQDTYVVYEGTAIKTTEGGVDPTK